MAAGVALPSGVQAEPDSETPAGSSARTPAARAAFPTLPPSPLTEEQQILHALNRLGYGPRPGDVERVRQTGLAPWIDRQLNPERIADEPVERLLAAYPTLTMPTAEVAREYPKPGRGTKKKGKFAEGAEAKTTREVKSADPRKTGERGGPGGSGPPTSSRDGTWP